MISYYDNCRCTKPTGSVTIDQFLFSIKNCQYKSLISRPLSDAAKNVLPAVTISGQFGDQRKKDLIIKHSGYICIDIDDVPSNELKSLKDILFALDSTAGVFLSASGNGLAWIVKVEADPDKHLRAFNALSSYLTSKTGFVADPACKDVTRLRFVSYDEDCLIRSNAKVFKMYLKEEEPRTYKARIKSTSYPNRFDKVYNDIVSSGTDITGGYNEWVRLGFALASHFGSSGEQYFLGLSQCSPRYRESSAVKQYRYCCRENGNGITLGTFFYYARCHGFEPFSECDKIVISQAMRSRKAGLKDCVGSTKSLLTTVMGMPEKDIDEALLMDVVANPKNYAGIMVDDGDPKALNIDEVANFINNNFDIFVNEITGFLQIKTEQVNECTGVTFQRSLRMGERERNDIFLTTKKAFSSLSRELFEQIMNSSYIKRVNNAKDFLKNLKWDGKDHLDLLVRSLKSSSGGSNILEENIKFQTKMVKRWLLGFFQNIFSDEACPLMLVLSGKGNTGKSYFFNHLLPKELNADYTAFSVLDEGKDSELLMTQKMLIIDDEYGGKSKADAQKLKRMLSASTFDLRRPYGRENESIKRIAMLGGTTNEEEVLIDPTGNRRVIVLSIQETMDWEMFDNIDKAQLFAQIKELYFEGETGNLTGAEIAELNNATEDVHTVSSQERELIMQYYDAPAAPGTFSAEYTNTEIRAYIEKHSGLKTSARKLGLELKALGYSKKINRLERGGGTQRVYLITRKTYVTQY